MQLLPTARPALVGTLSAATELQRAQSNSNLLSKLDFLELRLDVLGKAALDQLTLANGKLKEPSEPNSKILSKLLACARDPAEGGSKQLSLKERLQLLAQSLPHSSAIDLELRNWKQGAELLTEARAKGLLLIASVHDFEATPSLPELEQLLEQAQSAANPPNILKIAVKITNSEDKARLFSLLSTLSEQKTQTSRHIQNQAPSRRAAPSTSPSPAQLALALMDMGPRGKEHRLELSQQGSALLYGYLYQANAPGQHSIEHLDSVRPEWQHRAAAER